MDNNSEYLTDTYHIVGNKAFPLTQHILTPYKKSKNSLVQGHNKCITVNELMRTFHHIQFEGNSKRLFFMEGMFSVHSVYFEDELLC